MKNHCPICLFTYNRLEATKLTIEALKKNYLASQSRLIVFSDGGKDSEDMLKIQAVRNLLYTIDGFLSVEIIESPVNKGLASSIISGVSLVVSRYGKAIVLEDDLVTTPNFLSYMNQALNFYQDNPNIISVCGYGLKIKKPKEYELDVYLYGRSSSWGWATWKDRWETVDWDVKDWGQFKNDKRAIKAFNKNGSDMFRMLKSVMEGDGNSWAIRFCYAQFKLQKYSIIPFYSLVDNIGFSEEGTNTRFKFSRFKTERDKGLKEIFILDKHIGVNSKIQEACYRYHSIPIRIYSRIRYILGI